MLLAFHVWLLATQWAAGRLSEPGVLLRWAAAVFIGIALTALYRSGISLVSRKSMIIWLLAALLHGPAVASRLGEGLNLAAIPEVAITLVAQTAALGGALTLATLLVAAFLRRRTIAAPRAWSVLASPGGLTPLADGVFAVVSARPPPARL